MKSVKRGAICHTGKEAEWYREVWRWQREFYIQYVHLF